MNLVKLTKLVVRLGGNTVLQEVDFEFEPGEIVTIVGPNGSGKSTLLRVIIGALAPTSGQVHRHPKLRIGYVPQRLHLEPTLPMTVKRFLGLPRRLNSARVRETLDQVAVPELADHQMTHLSGGQFQRVLLARALLDSPDLLILDEPLQGLDHAGSADFYQQIEHVRHQFNCAVLMVSHDLHVVMSTSDRVICLNRHVCCEGTPGHVASTLEYRALFGEDAKGALALYRHSHDTHSAIGNTSEAVG